MREPGNETLERLAERLWRYRGQRRPPFAVSPGDGQESVWNYPRPPRIAPDLRRVRVQTGETTIAETLGACRLLETASPPTFYLPPEAVETRHLIALGGGSICEWKGPATYYALRGQPDTTVAWCYHEPRCEYASLAGWLSFYPGRLTCFVDGERVRAQPGEFYGGWVTNEIVGPFKGEAGSGDW